MRHRKMKHCVFVSKELDTCPRGRDLSWMCWHLGACPWAAGAGSPGPRLALRRLGDTCWAGGGGRKKDPRAASRSRGGRGSGGWGGRRDRQPFSGAQTGAPVRAAAHSSESPCSLLPCGCFALSKTKIKEHIIQESKPDRPARPNKPWRWWGGGWREAGAQGGGARGSTDTLSPSGHSGLPGAPGTRTHPHVREVPRKPGDRGGWGPGHRSPAPSLQAPVA